jgi:hypothetical protein
MGFSWLATMLELYSPRNAGKHLTHEQYSTVSSRPPSSACMHVRVHLRLMILLFFYYSLSLSRITLHSGSKLNFINFD